MKIALVLPTFNNKELTIKCINSIDKYADNLNELTIIWVDNGSSNDSKKMVFNEFKKCKNIKFENIFLQTNLGFIKAVNIGIKFALKLKYNYIGIINNDIEVANNWVQSLLNILKSDDDIMLAGAMSYNTDKKTINLIDLKETQELGKINSKDFNKVVNLLKENPIQNKIYTFKDFEKYDFQNTYVPYYAVIFKSIIFSKIGFLNENFRLGYGDDTEFNFRITKAGFKIAKDKNTIVIHNNGSTFNKVLFKHKISIEETQAANRLQLKISKSLNKDLKKKYVIYTAIINDYDDLKVPSNINLTDFDYVCFTNSPRLAGQNVYPWTIIDINPIIRSIRVDSPVKWARYFKTSPHLFFENYEKSIWIDSNINILSNPIDFFDHLKDSYILLPEHPVRNNIYEEIKACYNLNKEDPKKLAEVQTFLFNEYFPANGTKLVQSNVLLRNHNDKKCIFLMEKWWNVILNYSKRDQLSFNYVFWKYGGEYMSIPWEIISVKYFTTDYRHKGGK